MKVVHYVCTIVIQYACREMDCRTLGFIQYARNMPASKGGKGGRGFLVYAFIPKNIATRNSFASKSISRP